MSIEVHRSSAPRGLAKKEELNLYTIQAVTEVQSRYLLYFRIAEQVSNAMDNESLTNEEFDRLGDQYIALVSRAAGIGEVLDILDGNDQKAPEWLTEVLNKYSSETP